jgi:hypothetical protein
MRPPGLFTPMERVYNLHAYKVMCFIWPHSDCDHERYPMAQLQRQLHDKAHTRKEESWLKCIIGPRQFSEQTSATLPVDISPISGIG